MKCVYMGLIQEINYKFIRSINSNESLAGLIKTQISNASQKDSFVPQNYYYVTHLVNPIATYWSRINKDIKKSNDLLRKLFLGKKLERMAGYWFRKLPQFITEEGKLDGAFIGIPYVRGSIDFRIGEKIIEFKTKDEVPATPEEILLKYPQDVEQLAFYSILDTLSSHENYLVFMNNTAPYKIKAFKIKTTDVGKIKSLLIERIKLLNFAIEKKDPAKLGKCRYYPDCQFNENKICTCNTAEYPSINSLREGLSIDYDVDFTHLLEAEMEKSNVINEFFTTINIIAPRKCLIERKFQIESTYAPDVLKDSYTACLGNIVRRLSFNPTIEQNEYIKGLKKEERLYIAQRWLRIPSSTSDMRYELLPYTIRVSNATEHAKANRPTEYAIAELAIICATYGKQKGLIFTIHPNLKDHVTVSEIIFQDLTELLNTIRVKLDNLEKSLQNGDIFLNEPCPEWMNDKGGCHLIKLCHSKPGLGCIIKK